jgi:hypothetical protein
LVHQGPHFPEPGLVNGIDEVGGRCDGCSAEELRWSESPSRHREELVVRPGSPVSSCRLGEQRWCRRVSSTAAARVPTGPQGPRSWLVGRRIARRGCWTRWHRPKLQPTGCRSPPDWILYN